MNNVYINLDNVSKVFKDADRDVTALDEISLNISQGEYVSFVGASGAGKSTLLHLIGGLDVPTSGQLMVDGTDLKKIKNKKLCSFRNSKVGFVFQFFHLVKELTVIENTVLPLVKSGMKFRDAYLKAEELLKLLGLGERLNFYPSEISGGEQQRTAVARAIVNEPSILLCDEPTGNLDAESADIIRKLLFKLNKEKNITVLLVTHNMELAADAGRIIKINKGKIINDSEGL